MIVYKSVHGLVYKDQTICNPSTRESIHLPPIAIHMQLDIRDVEKDNYKIVPQYLLGFDSSTNTYKFLNVSRIILPNSERTEYRILTQSHTRCQFLEKSRSCARQLQNVIFRTELGVCCIDDVIFCLGNTYTDEVIEDDLLLAFEVGSHKFRVIPRPTDYCYIVQVGQQLALMNPCVVRDLEEDADVDELHVTKFEVMTLWILEDYEKQIWKKIESFMSPALGILRNEANINIKQTRTEAMGTIYTSEVLFHSKGWVLTFNLQR